MQNTYCTTIAVTEDIMSDSATTKNAIASGFKVLMEKKPFEKITVSDITSLCGLNRQTFYYHFQDKYDLLNWIFYNEVITVLIDGLTFENWSDKMLQMLYTIKNNSKFYSNALNTEYGNEFRNYLFCISTQIFNEIIDIVTNGYFLEDADKKFISEFYAYGVAGTIIKWVTTGMKESPENITLYMKHLVNDSKAFAVSRYMKDDKNE